MDSINDIKEILGEKDDDFIQKLKGLDNTLNISSFVLQFKQY
ncbi:hypothetical protein [Campylobacter majalis]